jgi:hypothetical protein
MSTATVSRKKKRLNREELDAAEKVLRKKYRHIVKGTLKNVSPNGLHFGKRTVKIQCATTGCDSQRKIATSDLAQVRYCTDCTQERRAARRRRKPR